MNNKLFAKFSLGNAYHLISAKLSDWAETAILMLPNFIISILILMFFVVLGKLIKNLSNKILARLTYNVSLRRLISVFIYIIVLAIGTFIALSVLKLDGVVTSLLAGAGVLGLALGFAFQEIASNYIAGTVMSINKPFELGDLIESNDFFGTVVMIHLRTTHLQTLQGQLITIPNSAIFKNPITNYTALQRRRVDLEIRVAFSQNLTYVKEVAYEAIKTVKDIKKDDISIYYTEFSESSVKMIVRYWIKFANQQYEYWSKIDEGIIALKNAFDAAKITIPYPIKTIEFGNSNFVDLVNKNQNSSE